MFIDYTPHRIRSVRSNSRHVKWADFAAPRPRQFETAELDPLYTDPNMSDKGTDELLPEDPSEPPGLAADPSSPLPLSVLPPSPTSSQPTEEFDAGATLLPTPAQARIEHIPLGLDVDPLRPPIIAILSIMTFIVIFLFVLLFILPITQSKRRRYHYVSYISEEERKSMAVHGYPPSSPNLYGSRPPVLSLHLDADQLEVPTLRRVPPGLQLGAAIGLPGGRSIPLAPPSPRSGGLPSNPRAGLPVRTPTLRSTATTPTSSDPPNPTLARVAPFRGTMLRPRSGVVTWSVVDPFDDYNVAWAGIEGSHPAPGPSHLRPPKSRVAQAVRKSIVSTLSFTGFRGSLYSRHRHTQMDSSGGERGTADMGGHRWESMIPDEGISPMPYAGDIRKAWT